ncbi:MAG: hypothetical protein KGD73_01975 [Candidatus Lokiarchaeota archaeon]|nr:hypothetical protein [Candidatus Lokiarchaeota archaeon]
MKVKRKIKEEFENQMGLKECDLEDPKYLNQSRESIDGKCKNFYEDEFNCKLTIDSKNDRIVKSECEKEN